MATLDTIVIKVRTLARHRTKLCVKEKSRFVVISDAVYRWHKVVIDVRVSPDGPESIVSKTLTIVLLARVCSTPTAPIWWAIFIAIVLPDSPAKDVNRKFPSVKLALLVKTAPFVLTSCSLAAAYALRATQEFCVNTKLTNVQPSHVRMRAVVLTNWMDTFVSVQPDLPDLVVNIQLTRVLVQKTAKAHARMEADVSTIVMVINAFVHQDSLDCNAKQVSINALRPLVHLLAQHDVCPSKREVMNVNVLPVLKEFIANRKWMSANLSHVKITAVALINSTDISVNAFPAGPENTANSLCANAADRLV